MKPVKRWSLLTAALLMFVLTAAACSPKPSGTNQGPPVQAPTDTRESSGMKTEKAVLYLAGPNAQGVVRVERTKPLEAELVPFLVEQLKDGHEAGWIIPKEARLLSYKRQGELLVLDFSQGFLTGFPGGTAGESITMAGIANTFTELPYVKKVLVLVEGKTFETGHNIYDEPLQRMENRIIQAY